MLVLSRKLSESIHIGDDIVIKVVQIRPGRVRLGIEAPESVRIQRAETVAGFDLADCFEKSGAFEAGCELEVVVDDLAAEEFEVPPVPAVAC